VDCSRRPVLIPETVCRPLLTDKLGLIVSIRSSGRLLPWKHETLAQNGVREAAEPFIVLG
jgi:hypothetical protein